jgi:threonine dehydrogenase-like Zn-dependent dehydrogenase
MIRLEFIKKNRLEWREYSTPKILGKNQVLVKPLVVSRCDLDLPILRGETLFRPPFPIGHEFIGEITETSDDINSNFPVGTRVIVPFQISCGHCMECNQGKSKSCSSVPHASAFGLGNSAREFGGAISDSILVPYAKEMLVSIKESTDIVSIASISDNLIEAWKLVGIHLTKNKDQSVLVLGGLASSIGIYTALLAKFLGCKELLYVDFDVRRLQKVESMGIKVEEVREYPRSLNKRYAIVADASNLKEAWMCGLRSLDIDGKFGSASIFWSNQFPIPYLDLYNTGASIQIGRVKSREWIPEILQLVEEKGFDPGSVMTKKVNWKEAAEAYLEDEIKLIIVR